MSYDIETRIRINLYCYKCEKPLLFWIPPVLDEMFFGSVVFACEDCDYKIFLKEIP